MNGIYQRWLVHWRHKILKKHLARVNIDLIIRIMNESGQMDPIWETFDKGPKIGKFKQKVQDKKI